MDAIKEAGVPVPPAATPDKAPNWRDSLEPRMRTHVAYCQNYMASYHHGAPGHFDREVIDALAKLLDASEITYTVSYEIELSGVEVLQQQIADLIAKHGGAL